MRKWVYDLLSTAEYLFRILQNNQYLYSYIFLRHNCYTKIHINVEQNLVGLVVFGYGNNEEEN